MERMKVEEEEEEEWGGHTSQGMLLALALGIFVGGAFVVGDHGKTVSDAVSGVLGPGGLLLLPIFLLLLISFLSSDRATALYNVFSTASGERSSVHRRGGSAFGVAALVLLLLLLLYSHVFN